MSKCVCCGAELGFGATKCKYCGAALPVTTQPTAPQCDCDCNQNQNQPQAPTQPQNQIPNSQMADVLQAWLLNNALTAEAARSAAEAARIAAEAARSAVEAVTNQSASGSSQSSNGENEYYVNIFADPNWRKIWEDKWRENREVGLILTNTKGLKNPDRFKASLRDYMRYKFDNGIDYYVLDLNNQVIDDIDTNDIFDIVWDILFEVYMELTPNYLMIVGDSTVVPCAEWENMGDPYEATVPSDLAYIALDETSPWDGMEYNFDDITQVGRIPAKIENDFQEAIDYFDCVKRFKPYSSVDAFGCSALVWERTSRVEFEHLNPLLLTSPEYTSSKEWARAGLKLLGKLDPKYNLLCFNLHGSDDSHEWYGQEGDDYPEAFEKNLLPSNNGYVLCTEACYGARHTYTDSMVVNALRNGCMAFVGSSRIAYGMANGSLSCADIVAQTFTMNVMNGFTVGRSFQDCLKMLSLHEMDEIEIKTLAEFSLYGDPSLRLIEKNAHSMKKGKKSGASTVKKYSKPKQDKSRAIVLASCDGSMAKGGKSSRIVPFSHYSAKEQSQMKMMANYVSKVGNDYMAKNFASVANVKPSVYKVVGKEEYRAVYSKKMGGIKTVVQVHTDGKGNVKKVYHSK